MGMSQFFTAQEINIPYMVGKKLKKKYWLLVSIILILLPTKEDFITQDMLRPNN